MINNEDWRFEFWQLCEQLMEYNQSLKDLLNYMNADMLN